jgi:hypothetical protein
MKSIDLMPMFIQILMKLKLANFKQEMLCHNISSEQKLPNAQLTYK